MIALYRPAQVRTMDERTIAAGTPSLTLMERAAGHLARIIVRQAEHRYGLRVLLLCGKGNNAGDGIAAARRLRRQGVDARIYLAAGEDGLSDDAQVQLQRYRRAGGPEQRDLRLDGYDVVADCLLGTGASGAPREPLAGVIAALGEHRAADAGVRVVACDLPTGVDADTGQVPGIAVHADATLSLGAHKRGLWLWPARRYCGELSVADLGLVEPEERPVADVLEIADVRRLLPEPPPDSHKRTRGVVVALAGSPGMTGAATLVARGAMAGGAGLITVATSSAARGLVAPSIPEALTVDLPMQDPDAAFEQLVSHLEGADALAIGPGLGHDDATVALVHRLVAEVDLATVLDADGLNAFRGQGDLLAKHAAPLLVCTPHAREFERLVDPSAEDIWDQRLTLVPDKARAWDSVLVAKGPGSLIAAPDGRVWINPTGSAALATGGTGDVMTGLLAAVVAQDPDPARVAGAVWLHGLAGHLAAARTTPRSVTAGDVAAAIPAALREVMGQR